MNYTFRIFNSGLVLEAQIQIVISLSSSPSSKVLYEMSQVFVSPYVPPVWDSETAIHFYLIK